jgi:hypothetical protein
MVGWNARQVNDMLIELMKSDMIKIKNGKIIAECV